MIEVLANDEKTPFDLLEKSESQYRKRKLCAMSERKIKISERASSSLRVNKRAKDMQKKIVHVEQWRWDT